jgi:hypothetical protein
MWHAMNALIIPVYLLLSIDHEAHDPEHPDAETQNSRRHNGTLTV